MKLTSYLLPKLRDIFFMAVFFAVIGFGPRLLNVDGDLGRHITLGEVILQTGRIPTQDPFSHTMRGQALTPHEWLADVFFALAYRLAGLNGVVWLCALLIALTFTLLFTQTWKRSKLILLALGMVLWAVAASSLHFLARPHLWTMLFLVLWAWGLETLRRGEGFRWWLLPLLMLVWVNTHGAFIAGFVVWGAYSVAGIAYQKDKKPALKKDYLWNWGRIGALSALATLLNPAGWRLWETTFGFLRNRYLVSHTAEYMPPDFHNSSTWPFLLLVVFSVLLLALKGKKLLPVHALLLTGWTAMALYSTRNVPLYAIIAAPILAEAAAEQWHIAGGLQSRLGTMEVSLKGVLWPVAFVVITGSALVRGAQLDFEGRGNRFLPETFPVQAADWLEENLQEGRAFNYFPWGGYLLYRFQGQLPVFIDGQTDFYGEALTREYEQVITQADGWPKTLEKYRVDWAILPADLPLVEALARDLGWQVVYRDETAAILHK
ncbi:MAG TPA: hypothetical protein G4N96_08975 [Chloroflexi bacterium]|nr:hypothetical protein [Chloroflexota bacterium]